MHRQILYRLTWLAAGMSLDHRIRDNAVGWPLTDQVNAFTLSLIVYPVIAWLVAFVAVLAVTCVYETRLWWGQRPARRAARPATGVGSRR